MTAYELMIKTNHYLIKGGELTNKQKENIVSQLLSARTVSGQASSMYPAFYIPPYNNGKKLKTVLGQTPQTQILSTNMYELEILRLLFCLRRKMSK